jgi:hypothetical protein
LKAEYITACRIAPARDVAYREKLWMAVNIVGHVRNHLPKLPTDGKLAQAELRMRTAKAAHARAA